MNRQLINEHVLARSANSSLKKARKAINDSAPKEGCLLPWRLRQRGAVLWALDLFAQVPEGIQQQLEYKHLKNRHGETLGNMALAMESPASADTPWDERQRRKIDEGQELKWHWQQLVRSHHVTDLDVFRCALEHLGLNPGHCSAWVWEQPRRKQANGIEYSKRMQQYRKLGKPAREQFLKELTVGQLTTAAHSYLVKNRPANCPTLAYFSARKSKLSKNVAVSDVEQAYFNAAVLKNSEKTVLRHIRLLIEGPHAHHRLLLRKMPIKALLVATVMHLKRKWGGALANCKNEEAKRYEKLIRWFQWELNSRKLALDKLEDRYRMQFESSLANATEDEVLVAIDDIVSAKRSVRCPSLEAQRRSQETLKRALPRELSLRTVGSGELPHAKKARTALKALEPNIFIRIKDDEYLNLLVKGHMKGDVQSYRKKHWNQMQSIDAGGIIVYCSTRDARAFNPQRVVAIAVFGKGQVLRNIPATRTSSCLEELTALTVEQEAWPRKLSDQMGSSACFDVLVFEDEQLYDLSDRHLTLTQWCEAIGCMSPPTSRSANVFSRMVSADQAQESIQKTMEWLKEQENQRNLEIEKAEQDILFLDALEKGLEAAYADTASEICPLPEPMDSPSDSYEHYFQDFDVESAS